MATPLNTDDRVRAAVRVLMAHHGHTTDDVARLLGVSANTVRRRMRAGRVGDGWTWNEVLALAEAYDRPLSLFVEGPDGLLGPGRDVLCSYMTPPDLHVSLAA